MNLKLPVNVEIEENVIAGMMNDEMAFYDGVGEIDADFFTKQENVEIYELMKYRTNAPSVKQLELDVSDVKTKSAIRSIDRLHTNYSDFRHSLDSLKEIYKKRHLYYNINKLTNRFESATTDELLEDFTREITSINIGGNEDEIIGAEEFGEYLQKRFETVVDNPDEAKGVPFSVTDDNGNTKGLPSLDGVLNGAQGGDLIMVAAKTGVGKTAFAINLARIFSIYQNYTGYYMNTEMSKHEMGARLASALASVDSTEIETGRFEGTEHEITRKKDQVEVAHGWIAESGFITSVLPHLPFYKAKGLANQTKLKYGKLDYVIVDYVGRMQSGTHANTWDELYEITRNLKTLAVELDIPIIMLAQRNQAGDVEGAKKMMNECDAVLYFEPIDKYDSYVQDKQDEVYINHNIEQKHRQHTNYKITLKKIRRNSNAYPIYCMFDRARSEVREPNKL